MSTDRAGCRPSRAAPTRAITGCSRRSAISPACRCCSTPPSTRTSRWCAGPTKPSIASGAPRWTSWGSARPWCRGARLEGVSSVGRMRITIVIGPFLPVPPVLGGAVEKVHALLAAAYRAAGHEVTIVSRRYKDFPDEEAVDGIRHLRIPSFDRSSSLAVNLVLDFIYSARAALILPAADVTVTNGFFLPLLLPRRRAGKIYVHVARYPKGQMALYFRADRLQAVSQAVAEAIAVEAPRLARRVVTIGYPIPDAYFGADPAPRRQRTVLFVGRIAREKGVDVLLRGFAQALADGGPAA